MKIISKGTEAAAREAIQTCSAGPKRDVEWERVHGRGSTVAPESIGIVRIAPITDPAGVVRFPGVTVTIEIRATGTTTKQVETITTSSDIGIGQKHAILRVGISGMVDLKDLGSAGGTYWGDTLLQPHKWQDISSDPEFRLGLPGSPIVRVTAICGRELTKQQPIPKPNLIQPTTGQPVSGPNPAPPSRAPTLEPSIELQIHGELDGQLRDVVEEYCRICDGTECRKFKMGTRTKLARLEQKMAELIRQGANPSLLPSELDKDGLFERVSRM